MNRRQFHQTLGGAYMMGTTGAAAQTREGVRTRLYRLSFYHLRMGEQVTRMNQFLAAHAPFFRKVNTGPLGFFNVFLGAHMPGLVILAGFPGFSEMDAASGRLQENEGFQRALLELQQGVEPPYDRLDTALLEAAEYSPEIVPLTAKPKPPRIFELRVYHSPTLRQLRLLHERFAGPEIKIFHRLGIRPVLYASTLIGPNMPNLTYLTPFASLAERDKAWTAFAADPEWVKVRNESIERGGQITSQISITLLRPTDYSPIQ